MFYYRKLGNVIFILVMLAIISLPVSRKWRLISSGVHTIGFATKYNLIPVKKRDGDVVIIQANEILYKVGDTVYTVCGPENLEYREGKPIRLIYSPRDPRDCIIYSFTGLYLTDYSILPLFLIVFWGAFYLTYNIYVKQHRALKPPDQKTLDQQENKFLRGG